MTQLKGKPLVPITREFLKQFYQKYPLAPVPCDAGVAHLQRIEELACAVTQPGSKVQEQIGMPTPTRIDDCFWRNRMICEELALSLSKLQTSFVGEPELAAACSRCHGLLVNAERSILAVQESNTSSVKAQLQQFIPQDFRGALLERQRIATEARYKKQVEDLVRRGGTIRQKYDLYLQQQWERRQALVQLGECSGMYKMVIKWVAGIPQVLLDFAKEINAKLGPMEEQRIKYGPDLYGITEMGIRLDVCLAAWAEAESAAAAGGGGAAASRAAAPRMADVVEPAVVFYCEQMLRVIRHIGNVFQHSPFFVNKDDLENAPDGGGAAAAEAVAKKLVFVDPDCASSTLSAVSGSGEYGAVAPPSPATATAKGAVGIPAAGGGATAAGAPLTPLATPPAPLQLSASMGMAPGTPGLSQEAPPRTATASDSNSMNKTTMATTAAAATHHGFDSAAAVAIAAEAISSSSPCPEEPRQVVMSRFNPGVGMETPAAAAAAAAPTPRPQGLTSGQQTPPQQLAVAAGMAAPMCVPGVTSSAAAGALGCAAAAAAGARSSNSGTAAALARMHLSGDSHVSFMSAVEQQSWWHNPEEGEWEAAAVTAAAAGAGAAAGAAAGGGR